MIRECAICDTPFSPKSGHQRTCGPDHAKIYKRQRDAEHKTRNQDRVREQKRQWRGANREKVIAQHREYRAREKILIEAGLKPRRIRPYKYQYRAKPIRVKICKGCANEFKADFRNLCCSDKCRIEMRRKQQMQKYSTKSEVIKAKFRTRYHANIEQGRDKTRRWRLANPDKRKAQSRREQNSRAVANAIMAMNQQRLESSQMTKVNKYHNQSSDQIRKDLDRMIANTIANLKPMADRLYVLWERGERHPHMRQGVLRWYREIATGKLAAHVAWTLGGVGSIVRKVMELPHALQIGIADGQMIIVAEHDDKGEIVPGSKTILQLTTRQLDMAFAGGALRTFEEQKKILAERKPDVRRSNVPLNIRADLDTGEIVIGQLRLKPIELNDALKQLGFEPIHRTTKYEAALAKQKKGKS